MMGLFQGNSIFMSLRQTDGQAMRWLLKLIKYTCLWKAIMAKLGSQMKTWGHIIFVLRLLLVPYCAEQVHISQVPCNDCHTEAIVSFPVNRPNTSQYKSHSETLFFFRKINLLSPSQIFWVPQQLIELFKHFVYQLCSHTRQSFWEVEGWVHAVLDSWRMLLGRALTDIPICFTNSSSN